MYKKVIDMDYKEAREFFLKAESYVNIKFPEYFNFDSVLLESAKLLKGTTISSLVDGTLSDYEYVHYKLLSNKDGKYSWRPLELLHPVVYVDLVQYITQKDNWKNTCENFLSRNNRIECVSLPIESKNKKSDTAQTITNWWTQFEQRQIELATDFEYVMHTDISNCYGSIYTHTIPWAIHGRGWAKKRRDRGVGNGIDRKLRFSQHGQTNGIPQGSVLMDFIAEIVLNYADSLLYERLNRENIEDYKILRYRDDYRIFTNRKDEAEKITQILSEVLADLNFKLNSNKTLLSEDIITDAVKEAKLYWDMIYSNLIIGKTIIKKSTSYLTFEYDFKVGRLKHLLQIKMLANKFPNSSSIIRALLDFYRYRIEKLTEPPKNIKQLISIIIDILTNNPVSIEMCIAVLSKLLDLISEDKRLIYLQKILLKFQGVANTSYAELWLQRLTIMTDQDVIKYESQICEKVDTPSKYYLWNSDWLKNGFNEDNLIDVEKIDKLQRVIRAGEVDLFSY